MANKKTLAERYAAFIEEASQPWPDEVLKFKIQSKARTQNPDEEPAWAQIAAYVDARDVIERLNRVGAKYGFAWTTYIEEEAIKEYRGRSGQPEKAYFVRLNLSLIDLAVKDTEEGKCEYGLPNIRSAVDYGTGDDPKAAMSDALKRVAVHFGLDGAYRGHRIYLCRGEFNRYGPTVDDGTLLKYFKEGGRETPGECYGNRQQSSTQQGGKQQATSQRQATSNQQQTGGNAPTIKNPDAPATDKQKGYIRNLMSKLGIKGNEAQDSFAAFMTAGNTIDNLTKGEAGDLITSLQNEDIQEDIEAWSNLEGQSDSEVPW